MFINSQKAEEQAVLNLAYSICAAVRTAPKACGIDHMDTAVLTGEDKQKAVAQMIKDKHNNPDAFREGTTPRVYADLIGSLCDLVGGSGDKGTPVVLVRGYFDDYTTA